MRMNPGPSSARLFSKCAQSTMSRASSATSSSSRAEIPAVVPRCRSSWKRVNLALAAVAVERVGAPSEIEPERDRADAEIAPHRVEEITPVALRKLFEPVAEHDEARRPRLHLGDVAQLDPLALGCRRRVGLDRLLEPAVELAG